MILLNIVKPMYDISECPDDLIIVNPVLFVMSYSLAKCSFKLYTIYRLLRARNKWKWNAGIHDPSKRSCYADK